MIKDPITITVFNSYDISVWEKEIIKRCLADNPTATHEELAVMLNISPKSLYRKGDEYEIDLSAQSRQTAFKSSETLRKLQTTI